MDIFSNQSAWDGLSSIFQLVSLIIQVISQTAVFVTVLYQQPSLLVYALVNLLPLFAPRSQWHSLYNTSKNSSLISDMLIDASSYVAWAATCQNKDYATMAGVDETMQRSKHRKEIIVGNLQEFLAQSM